MARQIVDSEPNALGQPGTAVSAPVEKKIPSYQPTRWPVVNRSLDFVDAVTHGRADWAQRLVSYLFVGGFAALINLAVFSIIYYWVFPIPPNTTDEFTRGTPLVRRLCHRDRDFNPGELHPERLSHLPSSARP